MHCLVFSCANCTCTSYFIEMTQRATHKTENRYGNEEKLDNNQSKNLNEEKIVKIKDFKEISPWLYLVEYNFINPFQVNVSFICPPENVWFSDVSRGYRNGALAWNGLLMVPNNNDPGLCFPIPILKMLRYSYLDTFSSTNY